MLIFNNKQFINNNKKYQKNSWDLSAVEENGGYDECNKDKSGENSIKYSWKGE